MKTLAIFGAGLVLTLAALTACGSTDGSSVADQQLPTAQSSSEDMVTMQSSPTADGTPITIDIGGRAVRGILIDNATARSLIGQFPLTLTFKDHGGQEKSARLPAPLSLEGSPSGSDADPLTIGYYAPDQVLVLYYEHVGRFNGIVRIGTFEDLAAVRDQPDGVSAKLHLAS
ncbi:hypothetical protein F8G81_20395 [Arthrobacter sp. CDRTa11]|uniref:cyclophilin-like fold protein n=1 Tax=Arthrobacter sp. CDRTa11 TaxID=2651199 RepID=UPI002265B8D5|nr:cyclophilin-like fold protein [Arthrobacter sp. CDRTa11]UZX04696.1 hypothetical protein F8G81_20395 [Arthrobacter sp. CDRTa11]